MPDPKFEVCARDCESGKKCRRKQEVDAYTGSELISNMMEMDSLPEDIALGVDLTASCRRLYEIRETYHELEGAFLLGSLVEQPEAQPTSS